MGHVQTVQTQIRASDQDLLYLITKSSIYFQIYKHDKVINTKIQYTLKYSRSLWVSGRVGTPQGMILNTLKGFSETFLP